MAVVLEVAAPWRLDPDDALFSRASDLAIGAKDPYLNSRPGSSDTPGMRQPLRGRYARRATFTGAIELVDLRRLQSLHDSPLDRDRTWCGGVHDQLEAREVGVAKTFFPELEEADEVGGNHKGAGDPMALDQTDPCLGIPGRHDHRRGADGKRGGCPPARTGVVGGPTEEVHVFSRPGPQGDLTQLADPDCVADGIGSHDSLGSRGGARGVEVEDRAGPAVPVQGP